MMSDADILIGLEQQELKERQNMHQYEMQFRASVNRRAELQGRIRQLRGEQHA